jgi:hypothetical protein
MNVETGTVAAQFCSGNICIEFSVLVLCSAVVEFLLLRFHSYTVCRQLIVEEALGILGVFDKQKVLINILPCI